MWQIRKDGDPAGRALFGRHYTYNRKREQISFFFEKNRNYSLFMGPGEKLVLVTGCSRALFGWRKFRDDSGQVGVNCSVFRNEGAGLSSDLIRAADEIAWERWPGERLYTYVDGGKTRRKRDPGRCFLKAGWRYVRDENGGRKLTKSGLYILECLPEWRTANGTDGSNPGAPEVKEK